MHNYYEICLDYGMHPASTVQSANAPREKRTSGNGTLIQSQGRQSIGVHGVWTTPLFGLVVSTHRIFHVENWKAHR